VPLRSEYPDIVKTLGERLNDFGRFNVLDQAKTDAFLSNSKTMGTLVVRELGKAFGLDAVISLGLYPSEGKLMATARIFYTDDASQLDTVVAMLDLAKTRKEPAAEVKPFFNPVKEERTITPELPILSKFFTTGDFDGDGKLEYAFSDGERVQIYRNEPSGWREVWTETVTGGDKGAVVMEWQGQSTVTQSVLTLQHINLDSADINGNGTPEIFLSAIVNGKVISSVIEFREGKYGRTAEVPGFLRTAADPGKGTVLLGQAYEPAAFYSGPVKQYVWSGGKYVPGEEMRLPKGTPLYGWTFANVGEANALLVVLDDDDHLMIYSQDSLIWKSAEEYPVVANYVFRPATGVDAVLSKRSDMDKSQRMRLRGRVLAADVNGDGKDEIVLPKNSSTPFLGGLSGAELLGFGWTGMRLDPVWSVKDIAGPVIDFRYGRDGSGSRISALVRTKGGLFTRDRQQMMIYGLK
jgi:outer membrane protein assembly factor BamB